jgi:HlyD family secretion protein
VRFRMSAQRLLMVALLIVAAAAAIWLGRGLLRGTSAAPSVPVETIARRDIAVTIEATGTVEPIDLVEVKSKASGQILRMPVEVGSVVRAGDLLAQIDTVDVANQYEQAHAAQQAAQAKVDVSTAQLARAEELFARQVITAVEHETAMLDFANAEAQLVKTRTDLDTARQRRADATVRAPIAGTILEQLVSTGQVISSATSSVSGGTALLRMADLGRIRLRALVSETDIGSVRPGQVATVSVDAFPQRPFQGEVEKIEPQAVIQQSVTMFPVLIAISNQDGLLLPGMNGEVSMVVDQRVNVPAVPLDAVRTVRELSTVAEALGMDPDSAAAQIARQTDTRARQRGSRTPGVLDPNRARHARTGGAGWAARGESGRPTVTDAGGPPPAGEGPGGPGGGPPPIEAGSAVESGTTTTAGGGSAATNAKTQVVFVKTAQGLVPRIVRLGISDFDYAEILAGINEGDEVALLSVAELQAKRNQDQSRIRERIGSTLPTGSSSSGSRTSSGWR